MNVKDSFVSSLWGNKPIEWTAKDSDGASGGILTMWKKDVIFPLFSFRTKGSLRLCAFYEGQVCYFVNVYSSCFLDKKRKLWSELVMLKRKFGEGWWCLGGDFKTTRDKKERIWRCMVQGTTDMTDFNEFIVIMEVLDLPSFGGIFTWLKKEGSARSRLDRFLLSEALIDNWKIVGQLVGEKDIFDHSPIWMKSKEVNWGPKPFKVNNCWFDHKDFFSFVEESWKKLNVTGKQAHVLKEKFKALRDILRTWNREKFGWVDLKVEEASRIMNSDDLIPINDDVINNNWRFDSRKTPTYELWKQLHLKENLLRQNFRQNWIREGDQNTKYFHTVIKDRRIHNNIVSLQGIDGSSLEDLEGIRKEVLRMFWNRFVEPIKFRPTLNGLEVKAISHEDNLFLVSAFTREKVRVVVWESNGDKILGPDGFNFIFLQECGDF
ncbi:uncharacterized protein LOC131605072 [Vicia villosa]|uniref:uncharacterized protein LOC131605072 n=1 Tax=Vicia villosa TaxID=3911 RepID=UPI00273B767A|nr:uncharacterized protein LOC131605072 [Vicia villosa]